jgi:hypothetical protein
MTELRNLKERSCFRDGVVNWRIREGVCLRASQKFLGQRVEKYSLSLCHVRTRGMVDRPMDQNVTTNKTHPDHSRRWKWPHFVRRYPLNYRKMFKFTHRNSFS